jgi:hypothetical protein
MAPTPATPMIAVSIGHQTRLYHALVTDLPACEDAPSTVTLHCGTLTEIAGFAGEPFSLESHAVSRLGRLVLVDATQLGWHRARSREKQALFVPADPVLVGVNSLQHWLWQRLSRMPEPIDHLSDTSDEK